MGYDLQVESFTRKDGKDDAGYRALVDILYQTEEGLVCREFVNITKGCSISSSAFHAPTERGISVCLPWEGETPAP